MDRSFFLFTALLLFLVLHTPAFAVEIAPRITDREIVERLTRLEEGQKRLEDKLEEGQKALNLLGSYSPQLAALGILRVSGISIPRCLRRGSSFDLRQEMAQRFETVLGELRTQRLHLSRLSGRLGYGLEYLVRGVVEEFAGKALSRSERLILKDPEGEVFGVPADIEFDLFASDGDAYLCEVKSHIEPDDVLQFHRKAQFAAKHIGRPFSRVMIGASMETKAEKLMESLSIRPIVRARIEE